MKKLLLFFIFLMPLALFAKFYDGKVIYKSGETVDLQINFPLNPRSKKLTVKIDGKTQKLDPNEIAYFTVSIDNGNSTFVFRRIEIWGFDKNGKMSEHNFFGITKGWAMVDKVYKNMIVYDLGDKYGIKKVRGKERMVVAYWVGMGSNSNLIGKPDEDITFVLFDTSTDGAFKKGLERAEKYLFDKCPNFSEKFNIKEMNRKEIIAYQIAEFYDKCAEN